MVGGSLRVLRLLLPLKLVAMIYNVAKILLKVALNTIIGSNQIESYNIYIGVCVCVGGGGGGILFFDSSKKCLDKNILKDD